MTLKTYNPVTSSQRGLILVDRSKRVWRGGPFKPLVKGFSDTGGRNNQGRITSFWRGGRKFKRLYRLIDFKRLPQAQEFVVQRIEYDPNRSAFIALLANDEGKNHCYILAPESLKIGDRVASAENADIQVGNTLPLANVPVGTLVHNVEMKIGKGGQIARAAGVYVQVVGRDNQYMLVKMPSGEVRKIHGQCRATIGVVSNGNHQNEYLAKAGRNRWKGWRPHVRGVAMNPIDHPHGGGEGRTSGGRHPVSPWGQSAKGLKTRSRKKHSSRLIVYRRNHKK